MRMNQKRTKDTKSRQVVIKDLAEKGRKEIPSQGNIHPPARVATQDSTQQASSTNLHLSVAYASYSSQPCRWQTQIGWKSTELLYVAWPRNFRLRGGNMGLTAKCHRWPSGILKQKLITNTRRALERNMLKEIVAAKHIT